MHPYILQSLASERARDMRRHAAALRCGRLARRGRPGAPAVVAAAAESAVAAEPAVAAVAAEPAVGGRLVRPLVAAGDRDGRR